MPKHQYNLSQFSSVQRSGIQVQLCLINYDAVSIPIVVLVISFVHCFTTTQPKLKTLYIHSRLKTASLCTKTTIKSASAPPHALGEEKGQRGKAEGVEEVEEGEEGEAARTRKEGEGGEGKAGREGAEPALVLRFGTVVGGGKGQVVVRGKTEGGGRGEGRSLGAEGGRRFWQTGADEEDEVEETGSW